MGTFSACLAPISGVLFVRRHSPAAVYPADGRYPHGKGFFCPLPWAQRGKLSPRHWYISACLAPLARVLFVRQRQSLDVINLLDRRYPHGKVYFPPRRERSTGRYRHAIGIFSACFRATGTSIICTTAEMYMTECVCFDRPTTWPKKT